MGAHYVFFGSNLVSQSYKKQKVVARSSTEVEYCALALALVEILCLQSLLKVLKFVELLIPIMFCDNVSAKQLIVNPIEHALMQHVEIDWHFLHDQVKGGTLDMRCIFIGSS